MTEAEQTPPGALSHVRGDGAVHMVDVSEKQSTKRTARAQAVVSTTAAVVGMIADGTMPKGEVFATARVAGILAAKRTSELVPLCHPLPIDAVTVELTGVGDRVVIETTVRTHGVTGVEMEALTAASIAALTVYDMIKAVDRAAVIGDVRVLAKDGGKSGSWSAA